MEINTNQNKKTSKIKKIIIALLFTAIGFQLGIYSTQNSQIIADLAKEEVVFLGKLTGKYSSPGKGILANDVNFNLFWEVWDRLKEDYVDREELSDKELFYGAIRGMVTAAGDPYTSYMDPKLTQDFENDLEGKFEGIGAEISIRKDILTIVAPLDDSPAQKAGVKAGDMIISIDGESTLGMTIDEAVRKIRGPKGEIVTLTIAREGLHELKDIEIIRNVIVLKSVKTEVLENNIFLIELSNFNGETKNAFEKAIKEILVKNPRGIILDLRNNPGGYLETSVDIASEWVNNGVIVSEQDNSGAKIDYTAKGRAKLADYPTVVLVNGGSASASEIVAGALKYHEKAIIVGEKTFGKGSVQALRSFSDGSSLKVTIAKWLTPDGISIKDNGIEPDIEIEYTLEDFEADRDPQMEKAIEILEGEESEN
jgi:carboxyl-terminal processing protease